MSQWQAERGSVAVSLGEQMSDWEERPRFSTRPARHRPRRRRRERVRREVTPEEQAYQEARRRADRKLSFVRHFVCYAFTLAFLLVVTRGVFVPAIVGLSWGIGLSMHFFQAIVAPELRRKWIQSEVQREVRRTVTRQRREASGDKTRSLEQLSASIAHEIRNPITAAKSLVQQMGEDPGSNENVEYAAVALEELDRVERSISHLLRYAREEDVEIKTTRLEEVVAGALETLRDRVQKAGVEVDSKVDAPGELEGDPDKLRRVFINLIGNALDALTEAGISRPRIDLGVGENLAGTEVWASVRDNGPGIDPERQDKIFTPFYTSRAEGTGLGLAITRKLVEAHGGAIELTSSPEKGTEFLLSFPKTQNGGGDR
ncbi:MAG: HAMP domain-containing histidine kinase [Deltaproteobacteria bacterium]|nr:HAMP domain-containing histidine kinase [Deltaproteobacteria bacterium]MBW2414155.1 HAMP domain-containing histidine kinase [Deltaproteobacteria bacterium]